MLLLPQVISLTDTDPLILLLQRWRQVQLEVASFVEVRITAANALMLSSKWQLVMRARLRVKAKVRRMAVRVKAKGKMRRTMLPPLLEMAVLVRRRRERKEITRVVREARMVAGRVDTMQP